MTWTKEKLRELDLLPRYTLRSTKPSTESVVAAPDVPVRAEPAELVREAATKQPAVVAAQKREPAAPTAATKLPALPMPDHLAKMGWDELRDTVLACKACGLCKERKQAVFGVGAKDAPWLFIGEGPGADEDEKGEPFVGQAGKLLDSMLQAAGLKRGREVYIANVVKCRPPNNRTPSLDEAAACSPYLDRQIELIKPKLIVALGKTALQRLTGAEESMAALRGKVYNYRGVPVVTMYHPAYFLRNQPEKAKGWEDILFAKRVMADILTK